MGLGIAGMIVTKETFFVHLACFVIAIVCLKVYERFSPSTLTQRGSPRDFTRNDFLKVLFISVFGIFLFYTGFFLHKEGALDFFKANFSSENYEGARVKFIPLAVSAPFHSSLMKPAAERLKAQLDKGQQVGLFVRC